MKVSSVLGVLGSSLTAAYEFALLYFFCIKVSA